MGELGHFAKTHCTRGPFHIVCETKNVLDHFGTAPSRCLKIKKALRYIPQFHMKLLQNCAGNSLVSIKIQSSTLGAH